MSHLACADTPDHPLNDQQIRLFREIRMHVPRHPVLARQFVRHLPRRHRRIAIWCGRASRFTAAIRRPGKPNPMRPVVELKARIIQVRTVKTRRDRRLRRDLDRHAADAGIAVVARRLCRRLSCASAGAAEQQGRRAEVDRRRQALPARRPHLDGSDRGRRHRPARGHGAARRPRHADRRRTSSVDDVAAAAGTIGYEVLTSLGRRYHRVYATALERESRAIAESRPWPAARRPSSARTAAPPTAAGRASARPAASGTRSSRKASAPARPAMPGRAPRKGRAVRARAARRRDARRAAPRRPASPSSTASPAAASCAARCCCSAAIPASANRRC